MLESSALEMGGCGRHRRAANAERDGRRPKIEQRQHDLQHGLKARAVVGQLELGRNLAILEGHRRGGVGPQPKAVPGARDRKSACARGNEIERRVGRARALGASAETT